MKISTVLFSLALGALCAPAAIAQDVTYLGNPTLEYPYSQMGSMAPSTAEFTWDNQPLELIDPVENEDLDEVVYVNVYINGDSENPYQTSAGIMHSESYYGDDEDIWRFAIDLYLVEELYEDDVKSVTINVPQGVVKNDKGDINREFNYNFYIFPTYTDYTISPDPDTKLMAPNAYIYIDFGGNRPSYISGSVRVERYDDGYELISLTYGENGFFVNDDNQVVINLNNIPTSEQADIILPEGRFTITVGEEIYINPDIWVTYDIENEGYTIVNGIKMENTAAPVFNLRGVKVGTSDSFRKTESGIYIIGGKKVMIK